jgi:aspartyl/asparaginyl beta-hydroxylase (cupin superfamily)
VRSFNPWFGRVLISAARSPNDVGSDQTGFINQLTQYLLALHGIERLLQAFG